MKAYIWKRIFKSLFSIFMVTSIVIVMLYTMIPREKVFHNDQSINKMKGDAKLVYQNSRLEELGYLDYMTESDILNAAGTTVLEDAIAYIEKEGYKVDYLQSGVAYAQKDYNALQLVAHFWTKLLVVDHPNVIKNDQIEHKYYFGTTETGGPALKCSGCKYKYQIYFDTKFPFIHQHILSLDFGISYPVKAGYPAIMVISEGQGSQVQTEQTFPTGKTTSSALILTSCKYKDTLDRLDKEKFTDNYSDCQSQYESPSMIMTSYIFGIVSLILAYAIGLPSGVLMSRHKDQTIDKIGMVYINLLIAVPSLAFIFFVRQIGVMLGLPDKFPILGFSSIKSYIAPMLILGLMSTPGLMMWTRRYMIDQASADYVKFARAKGLSEKEIFDKHILKNAVIPVVNGIPGSIILCISGAFITESAFAIPGMGKMLPDSINNSNNNMVICLVLIFTFLGVFSTFAGDLLMTVVDPRIKLTSKGDE